MSANNLSDSRKGGVEAWVLYDILAACCKRPGMDVDALQVVFLEAVEHLRRGQAICSKCWTWQPIGALHPQSDDSPITSYLCALCLTKHREAEAAAEHKKAIAAAKRRPVVYFLRHPKTGYIKIGRTVDFASRKPMLDKAHGVTYEVVHQITTDSPEALERRLHEHFADRRYGPWELFALTETELAELKRIASWNFRGPKDEIRVVASAGHNTTE